MYLSQSGSFGQSAFQLIVVVIIFIVVLILTYYTTKWIAGYQKNHTFNQNLKVIETMKLTNNKFLQIIEVGKEQFYIIALGKDEVTLIGQITKEQLVEISNDKKQDGSSPSFDNVLQSFKSYLPKK